MQNPSATIFFTANLAAAPVLYVFRKLLPLALVVVLAAASLNGVSAATQGPDASADLCSIRPRAKDGIAKNFRSCHKAYGLISHLEVLIS